MKIKQVMIVVFILAAFQLMTGAALRRGARSQAAGQMEEEPSRLMTPAQYKQFLASLKTDLTRWQAHLAEINVGALGLNFIRGKTVEGTLSRAKRAVGQCQKFAAGLEKRQTLGDSVRLYSCMELLGQDVSDLEENLNLMGDSAEAPMLIGELNVTYREIDEDSEKLFRHVLSLADIVDDSCPQLRRYLH